MNEPFLPARGEEVVQMTTSGKIIPARLHSSYTSKQISLQVQCRHRGTTTNLCRFIWVVLKETSIGTERKSTMVINRVKLEVINK